MRTDTASAIQGALGIIEDDLQQIEHTWTEAMGEEAAFDQWYRGLYLALKEEWKKADLLTRENLGVPKGQGITETAIKDALEHELRQRYPDVFKAHLENARLAGKLGARFKSLDTRRSIAQTVVKIHLAGEPQHGQGAHGQAGVGE